MRISWLKFEPRVSNFPLIKSDISDFITASTKFFLFFLVTKLFFTNKIFIKHKKALSFLGNSAIL